MVWTPGLMLFLQQTNAVLGYSTGDIVMERGAAAQGSGLDQMQKQADDVTICCNI